jgi:hypothetical protein
MIRLRDGCRFHRYFSFGRNGLTMPRKSKSKKASDESVEIAEDVSEQQAQDVRSQTMEEPQTQQSNQSGPYEDRRKEMQRKLQKLVLTMRNEGRTEFEIKQAINKEKRKEERKIIALEEKRANEQKACSNDVIIIPVAWKRNQNEKISVDATCDNVRRALFSTGLHPWLDCRREYSPGQKFAYWEHMGVKFRIEIGPEDIAQGVCRVVRADKPGAYLEHKREKPELNLQQIIRALRYLGLEKCDEMNAELMSDESLIERPAAEQWTVAGVEQEDEVGGNAIIPEPKPGKKLRRF